VSAVVGVAHVAPSPSRWQEASMYVGIVAVMLIIAFLLVLRAFGVI
jgi:hypothetical protein